MLVAHTHVDSRYGVIVVSLCMIVEAPSVCSVLSRNTPRLQILIKGEISNDLLGEWMPYDSFHDFLLAEGGGPIQSL